ncbi:hypothetical protein [Nocardia wallacei]|uniref:hypothetical protein n=1 Tax=Nocardia wallacei TaxID=480035 RepID=UPI002457C894|nr:hypothetical protein [Nocardia wallacei]
MVQQFGQLLDAGIRCWGLGLMAGSFSAAEKHDNGQYRLTFADDDGDPAFSGLLVDMDGNGFHAVMPRDSASHVRVHSMPSAGHRRTVLCGDPMVRALESNARALPDLWHRRDMARFTAQLN